MSRRLRKMSSPALISDFRPMRLQYEKPGSCGSRAFVSVVRQLLAANGVLDAADGVLHLAGGLFRLAFAFELGVARGLAGNFLHLALGLMQRAFNAILVHVRLRLRCGRPTRGPR